MYRYLFLMITLLTLMGCRDEAAIAPYLGPYYGGFDTAMTPDPGDDLNPNECSLASDPEQCSQVHGNPLSHLLMKLGIDEQEQLTLAFYRTQADYEAERPMYLSNACKTSVAPATHYDLHPIDKHRDDTQLLATARFGLEFGSPMLACTNSARFSSAGQPALELSLQVNPVSGARAVSITMERSRRDGDYLYIKQDGDKVPVKLDLRYVGTDADEARRVCAADDATALENKDGYRAVCVMTGSKKWSVVLPLSPWGPGVTAFWGTTLSPKWYRSSGEPDIVTYHSAVFLPVQFESPETEMGR